ncbi:MAG: tRNA (N6-isopentenyl adenosine(37)-C2)-methylthiotransferase MiaB [Verrucomicrobiales bacterium]|nr:tRNA (N6-isopentenyl adenosine(37)-C2)-methylthiotransferase MiaB [Verrucomicrobiales bacterium]MED5585206.1 tRNA (N6-isopentenyl adenosine(37)-C2)-methylthiotransferase MiaB [Verrucomicrobiota bacterium]
MPKVYIKTYGCQMNERDSAQVARMLTDRGYLMTEEQAEADVVLINTCSVRDMAEQKALNKMSSMLHMRKTRPHMVYGFMGCMAQSRGEELLGEGADLVVGTQKYHRVADYVSEIFKAREDFRIEDLRTSIVDTEEEEGSQNTIRDGAASGNAATAFVSIMQGCNMKCSFCIVPYTRGAERSRPIDEVVDEVERLAAGGVREVTLLGQIVNLYGRHEFPAVNGKSPFVQLLEKVASVDGIERVRFTSPHPVGYKQDLIEAFGTIPELVEHVHFPVQSGSNKVLKAMRRPYKVEKFEQLIERMREVKPEIAVTTDIIVGFPGEGDEEFAQTRALCERVRFDNAFVFRYSKRRGTPAAVMEDSLQVSERVKEERNKDLLRVVDRICTEKNMSLVGTCQQVLCEGPSKRKAEKLTGRTRTNKIVIFDGERERLAGSVFDVKIEHCTGHVLYGTPLLNC